MRYIKYNPCRHKDLFFVYILISKGASYTIYKLHIKKMFV